MLLIGEDNKTFTELWEGGEYNVDPDPNFTQWSVVQLYDNREFRANILSHWGNLTQVNAVTLGETLPRYVLSH